MPTNEPFYEHLPCQLDSRELVLKSKSLAQCLADQAAIEFEKKEANADFKQRLDAIDAKMVTLADEVRTGREYRDVPCIESAEWSENRVNIIRTDTGEVVRIRPLQQGERQEALPYARAAGDAMARAERAIEAAEAHLEKTASARRADNTNDEFKEKLQ